MRNGLLLLAIIVALTAIYFLEEQEERKSAKIIEQRRTIISSTILKHLTEIRGNNFHLIKDDHGFHTKDSKVKVDPQHVTSFIKIVTAIKAIKEISAQEIDSTLTSIFANKAPYIEFYIAAQKKVTITLGSKLGYDTSFYLRATDNSNDHTRYYIAEDTNPINQLFMVTRSKSLHNSKAYHQRMTNLFNISDHFFYDLKLLQLSAGEKITNIKVKNLRNRPFSVDAQKITTSPLERSHLAKDNPTQIENFLQLINTMRATEYYPQTNPQDLANRVASFIISTSLNRIITLKLYRNMGQHSGHYLHNSEFPGVFKLDNKLIPIFFSHQQLFWERIPFAALEVVPPKTIALHFSSPPPIVLKWNGKTQVDFKPQIDKKELELNRITDLLSILALRPADYLSSINTLPTNTPLLAIKWDSQQLLLWRSPKELLVAHPASKTLFHFLAGKESKIFFKRDEYFANSH